MKNSIRGGFVAGLALLLGCAGAPALEQRATASPTSEAVVSQAPAAQAPAPQAAVQGQGMRIDIHTLPVPPHVLRVDADGRVDLAELMTALGWAQRTPILVDPAVHERVVLSGVMFLPGMADALRDVDIVRQD